MLFRSFLLGILPLLQEYERFCDRFGLRDCWIARRFLFLQGHRKVATIQYALLIGLQHICSEIPTYDFKELQNMLLEKFEIKQ